MNWNISIYWTYFIISCVMCYVPLVAIENGVFVFLRLKAHSQVWQNFWQLKALKKWGKMVFISPQKFFLFSRYWRFCLDFLLYIRSSSESLGSMRLLFVLAASVFFSVISKRLLLRHSAFDSRVCCSFNISKPLAQGWLPLKQWIKWSSLSSVFKFNPQLLNDLIIKFF